MPASHGYLTIPVSPSVASRSNQRLAQTSASPPVLHHRKAIMPLSVLSKLTRTSSYSDSESQSSSSEGHGFFNRLRGQPRPPTRRLEAATGLTLSSLDLTRAKSLDDLPRIPPKTPVSPSTPNHQPPPERLLVSEALLKQGVPALRFTHKKKTHRILKLNLETFTLSWTRDNRKTPNSLALANVKQIRTGADAKNYREEFKVSVEFASKWISIIYFDKDVSNLKALHLVMATPKDLVGFVRSVTSATTFQRDLINNFLLNDDFLALQLNRMALLSGVGGTVEGEREIDLMAIVNDSVSLIASKPQRSHLTFEDTLQITRQLHLNLSVPHLQQIFSLIDNNRGYLDFAQFKQFVRKLKKRTDVKAVFRSLTAGRTLLFTQFHAFLTNVQKEAIETEAAFRVFSKFALHGQGQPQMTVEAFNNFLASTSNSHLRPLLEDLTKPLNQYFISSSHNTYLLGRQVGGESLIELYIKALQRGCRCVEIDIWDDLAGTMPIVSHGRSFTSPVDLLLVVEAIRKYAFITTPFPLILSLEIHCSPLNQLRVREMMIAVFGEMLVLAPLEGIPKLPSPMDLKHKILVKVKKALSGGAWGSRGSVSSSGTTASSDNRTGTPRSSQSEDRPWGDECAGSDASRSGTALRLIRRRRNQGVVTPELLALGVYVLGQKFNNFSLPESKTFNHCFSFNEKKLDSLLKDADKRRAVNKHNVTFLMRVYPSRFRLASSNFSPLPYWAHGVQMVSTNWQTYDVGQQLNEAMFAVGLRAGYLLKPERLRTPMPRGTGPLGGQRRSQRRITMTVDLLSGQQIPKPHDFKYDDERTNPFVEIQLFGFTSLSLTSYRIEDQTELAHMTCDGRSANDEYGNVSGSPPFASPTVWDNGFNPLWNTRFVAVIEATNEFTFVRFTVKSGEALIGSYMARLDYLSQGVRYLPIYDRNGEEFIFSSLLVKLTLDYT